MTSNSFKFIFLFIIVSLYLTITVAQIDDTFFSTSCGLPTFNSTDNQELRTLLSSLTSNATIRTFYNDTVMGRNPSDTLYGLFMCRGDLSSQLCEHCVRKATQKSNVVCSSSKQVITWYDECMVRYSDIYFFSTVDTDSDSTYSWLMANVSNQANFMHLLLETMTQTAKKAAQSSFGDNKYYATNQTTLSEFQTLYSLAQCTQDLSPQDCTTCLTLAIHQLPSCCQGSQGARVVYPSCNIRYELYPFYRVTDMAPVGIVPQTKYPRIDSNYSEDPGYISHHCSTDQIITNDTAFSSNLRTLLSDLSSNATSSKGYRSYSFGTVYGLFMCRGDISPRLCGECVGNATHRIASECRLLSREAIIWYDHCLLRYSNRNFFSTVDTSPRYNKLNITNTYDNIPERSYFTFALSTKLAGMANVTGNNGDRYLTGSLPLNNNQTLHILAQCTRDLSSQDCGVCLNDVIGSAIPWSRLGSVGGRVLYPSCNLRFELFKFYDLVPGPISPPPPEKTKGRSRTTVVIVVPIILSVVLFSFSCHLIQRKGRKSHKTILRENFGQESTNVESLQFDITIIEAATNNFSHKNKIGKGGFGEVYKGILFDGRHVAIKRLSKNSRQGVEEFKNEVLLIAKLQHRNLVTFIGFCIEEQEKILVYEYVPNKSLDNYLFDTQEENLLSWVERYKIIEGIARGILYLHEYSRLKVIHRDLKPSNILLDENMNPKISDFGLAKIVEIDQEEGNTNKIVGTYGYMSPEYAMLGQFSEKSDVFSFGVMILEIITGKKNTRFVERGRTTIGLLSFVWRHWKDQTPLNILDPKLKANYSENEVIKCIQIGLLCVQENPDTRPTMVSILLYLSSSSIELPYPQEPAFYTYGRINPTIVVHESSCNQAGNSSTSFTINEMSSSTLYAR